MATLVTLAPALYLLFTQHADDLARATGFIRRVRGFSGRVFVQTLVFGWLRRPAAPPEELATALGISRQGLHQRFTAAAVAFCQALLAAALRAAVAVAPALRGCLARFAGLYVDDCTQLALPPGAWGAALRLKAFLRWEVLGGHVHALQLFSPPCGDTTALDQAPPLPAGALHVTDLGFTDFARLRDEDAAGIYFLTRLPAQTRLFGVARATARCQPHDADSLPLWRQLRLWRQQGQASLDVQVRVGDKEAVAGRLVALACPPGVVARRLARLEKDARHRGRPVSERQREFCHWTVLFTNVPPAWLTPAQLWEVYRLRWQIELLVKRFKSEGGLRQSGSQKPAGVWCEWCLKLLGQVVRNWLQLLRGGPLCNVNPKRLGRTVSNHLERLGRALRQGIVALWDALWELREALLRVRQRTRRRGQPTAAQRWEQEAATAEAADGAERETSATQRLTPQKA
jgi:Transposase DDE domain